MSRRKPEDYISGEFGDANDQQPNPASPISIVLRQPEIAYRFAEG